MPELPEVEATRRNLERWLVRKRITAASLAAPRLLGGGGPQQVAAALVGQTVRSVERRGKWLRLGLAGGAALYSHLGMTGKWLARRPADAPARFERARLDGARVSVRYVDPRRFGRLWWSADGSPPAAWRALGPDPLHDGIDVDWVHRRLGAIQRSIKEALLEQRLFAGVGNIQAQEALWRARIHPARPAASLSRAEVAALARGLEGSIADTLARLGEPEIAYVEEPGADNPFDVYGKAGSPCPRCRTRLERLVQAGRSTVFCPRCQPRTAPSRRRAPAR